MSDSRIIEADPAHGLPEVRQRLHSIHADPADTWEIDGLCWTYTQADEGTRRTIRRLVYEVKGKTRTYDVIFTWASPMAEKFALTREPVEWLRRFLLCVLLTDGSPDGRDTLLMLADLWQLAEGREIDPAPLFHEVAALSEQGDWHAGSLLKQITRPARRRDLSRR